MADDDLAAAAPSIHLPAVAVTVVDGVAQILMLPGESGEAELFPVRRAGKKAALRFAVGEPGRRGTIWRLWASRDTDDVYLGSRKTSGEVKISLHQSGDWRIQLVDPDRPKTVIVNDLAGVRQGRILDQWTRPAANPVGWTHALSLVLPAHHLVGIPDDGVRWDDVRWHPEPYPGEQVDFEIHVVSPQQGVMSYQDLIQAGGALAVMDGLQLASGEVVIVLAIRSATTEGEAEDIARCENLVYSSRPAAQDFDPSPHLGPRSMLFGVDSDGRRRFYDFAYELPADSDGNR